MLASRNRKLTFSRSIHTHTHTHIHTRMGCLLLRGMHVGGWIPDRVVKGWAWVRSAFGDGAWLRVRETLLSVRPCRRSAFLQTRSVRCVRGVAARFSIHVPMMLSIILRRMQPLRG